MIGEILISFSLAVLGLAVHQATRVIPFKPFNCELCMVFWVAVICTMVEIFTSFPIFHLGQFVGIAIFIRQLLYRVWQTMF